MICLLFLSMSQKVHGVFVCLSVCLFVSVLGNCRDCFKDWYLGFLILELDV